jgi:hypothetical protein
MKVWLDDYGNMFLIRGWQEFTTHYQVQVGHALKLRYRGHGRLSVKIFDDTLCRQSYYPPLEDEFGPTTPRDVAHGVCRRWLDPIPPSATPGSRSSGHLDGCTCSCLELVVVDFPQAELLLAYPLELHVALYSIEM